MAQKFGRTMPGGPIKPPRIGALDATLRDEFAMVALHALLMTKRTPPTAGLSNVGDIIGIACYAIADGVMRARERK
jgi:hypothetical protein